MNEETLKNFFDNNQLLDFYKEAIQYSPFLMDVHTLDMYAKCLYKMKKFDEFHYIANILLKKDKNNYVIFEYLGLSHYRCSNLTESLYNFRRAIEIKPTLFLSKCYAVELTYRLYKRYNVNELLYLINHCFDSGRTGHIHFLRIFIYILIDQNIAIGKELIYRFVKEIDVSHLLYSDFFTCDRLNDTTYSSQIQLFKHYGENNQSSTLFITFSPGDNFILKKYKFPMTVDRLCFVDNTISSHGAFSYEAQYHFIRKVINKNNYERVFLCSASKTSCILAYCHNQLNIDFPNIRTVSVMASPIMQIYPFNSNLYYRSYYYLMPYVETNPFLRDRIKLLQVNLDHLNVKNLTVLSPTFKMDFIERNKLPNGCNLIKLDIDVHNTLGTVTLPDKYKEFDDIKSAKVNTGGEFDDDNDKKEDIYKSLWAIYCNPDLKLYNFYE